MLDDNIDLEKEIFSNNAYFILYRVQNIDQILLQNLFLYFISNFDLFFA